MARAQGRDRRSEPRPEAATARLEGVDLEPVAGAKGMGTRCVAAGRDLLGPLLWDFAGRLHVLQQGWVGRSATALYVARGGLRIRHLYHLHLGRRRLSPVLPQSAFFISRLSVCKGCLLADFDHVASVLVREFGRAPLRNIARALSPAGDAGAHPADGEPLSGPPDPTATMPADLAAQPGSVELLRALLDSPWASASGLCRYLGEQGELLAEYVCSLTAEARTVLLVDTGWSGTSQLMLGRRFPERLWMGLYFGRWNHHGGPLPHLSEIVGIAADHPRLAPGSPARAIFDYGHLIESVLEARFASIEGYRRRSDGSIEAVPQPPDGLGLPAQADDGLWSGILEHFHSVPADLTRAAAEAARAQALGRLARSILTPSAAAVEALAVPPRSGDVGRGVHAPVVLPARPGLSLRSRLGRARRALWRQGQLRTDFPIVGGLLCRAYNLGRRLPEPVRGWGARCLYALWSTIRSVGWGWGRPP